jgi:coenzyme F420-reducing hydrogenase delta subunit
MKIPERKGADNLLFYCKRQHPSEFPSLYGVCFDGEKAVEVEIPCSGRIGTGELLQGIAAGYKKVAILSCGVRSCLHGFGCKEAKAAFEQALKLADVAGVARDRFLFIEADSDELEIK